MKHISFACGTPNWDTIPLKKISTAINAVINESMADSILGYGSPYGTDALRKAISNIIAPARGIKCSPDNVIITAGNQQALALLIMYQRVNWPNSIIVLENPGYTSPRRIAACNGVKVTSVEVDDQGAIPLKNGLPEGSIVILTPMHHFPTGVELSEERGIAFSSQASKYKSFVIEDDYLAPFSFIGFAPRSLYSRFEGSRIIYIGSFSKTFAPGLRLGYIIADKGIVTALAHFRWINDRHSPQIIEQAMARIICDGHYFAHEEEVLRVYSERWFRAKGEIEKAFGYRVTTKGGLSLWIPLDIVWDEIKKGTQLAAQKGVYIEDSSRWYSSPPIKGCIRLGITNTQVEEISEGICILANCLAKG